MDTNSINNFRFCKKCQRDLPKTLKYFTSRKTDKDGYSLYCKQCINNEKKFKRLEKRKNWDKGGNIEGQEGRKCTICKNKYPATSEYFGIHKTCSSGLDTYCKICRRQKGRENYKKNNKEWNKNHIKNRDFKKNKIIEIKEKSQGCCKCGEKKHYLLDFHHVDSYTKSFQISQGESKGLKRLLAEIEKCVLMCSNCHREFHYFEKIKGINLKEYLNK
jgi:hypothetical protein